MALWPLSLFLLFANIAEYFLMSRGDDLSAVYCNDTSWMNVGDCGKGLTCDAKCQQLCLKQHNYYRFLHNAPPLKCDHELAKTAQEWMDEQARKGYMHHSQWTDEYTKSISWKGWGWEGMEKMEGAIPGATRGWYSEIKQDYNFQTGEGNGQVVGHFQAIVRKSEGRLGCGLNIKPGDGTYVTADYAPASHAITPAEREKITPQMLMSRKNPDPSCEISSSDRQECGPGFKAPFVTPEQCILAGCCYDDMFMSEPSVKFYADGRTWCFKKKGSTG